MRVKEIIRLVADWILGPALAPVVVRVEPRSLVRRSGFRRPRAGWPV